MLQFARIERESKMTNNNRLLFKIFTGIVAFTLVFGVITINASTNTKADFSYSDLLINLEILPSDYVKSNDDALTRGEFIRLALCLGKIDFGDITDIFFDDVPYEHEMAYSINKAFLLGYVSGYEDKTFRPDNLISFDDAIAIIMRVIGYEEIAQAKDGYLNAAYSLRFLDGLTFENDLTYKTATRMLYNVLMSEYIYKSGYSRDGSSKYNSFIRKLFINELFDIYKTNGVVEAVGEISYFEGLSVPKNSVQISGNLYEVGSKDLSSFIGKDITLYYEYNDNIKPTVKHVSMRKDTSVIVDNQDIYSVANTRDGDFAVKFTEGNNTRELIVSRYLDCIYNNRLYKDFNINSLTDLHNGKVTFISREESSGKHDLIIVKEYRTAILEDVDYTNEILFFSNRTVYGEETIQYEMPDDYAILDSEGIKLEFLNLKAGYIVSIAKNADNTYAEVIATNRMELHSLTTIDYSEGIVVLGDKEYDLSFDFNNKNNKVLFSEMLPYYINAFGEVVAVDDSNPETMQYGFFIDYSIGVGLNEKSEILIISESGKKEIYKLHKTVLVNDTPMKSVNIKNNLNLFNSEEPVRQLIKYKVLDGKVREIHTAIDRSTELNYKGFDIENFTCDYDTGATQVYMRYSPKVIANKYLVDQNTTVFIVPQDPKDSEKYEVVKQEYFKTDYSSLSGVRIYDSDECRAARIVVIQSMSVIPENSLFVCDKVSKVLDNEKGEVTKLIGYYEGVLKEYIVDTDRVNVEFIKRGDCLSLKLEKDLVVEAPILASADSNDLTERDITSNWGIAIGDVYKKNPNAIALKYEGDNMSSVVFPVLSSCYVYRYNKRRSVLSVTDFSAISTGNRVVIHRGSDQAKSIVLYE